MKAPEKIQALAHHAVGFGKRWVLKAHASGNSTVNENRPADYPQEVLDLIIFHRLHLSLPAASAIKSYQALKERFVDWNEVRISSVREIQEALSLCPGSLELAVFIKDILEVVHRERQDVSLEFLAEKNLGEIRQYLKKFRGIDRSTVELILRQRKEHPVFPLSQAAETVLIRLGVLRPSATRSRNEKSLHELVDPAKALVVHHFLLNHSRAVCPPDESAVDCPRCSMRQMCAFYARTANKHRKSLGAARRRFTAARVTRKPSKQRALAKKSPVKGAIKGRLRRTFKRSASGKQIRRVSR